MSIIDNSNFVLCRSALLAFMVSLPTWAWGAEPIPVWPGIAPGSEGHTHEAEVVTSRPGQMNVTNVHTPTITPFLPSPETATGTSIIVIPGGGHKTLCLGHEGTDLAEWFAEHGIAAFVLKYRLAKTNNSIYTVDGHAMADLRRAIRLVRSQADHWQINPDRLGVVGFSAGGELAALSAMNSDPGDSEATDLVERESSRPDYQVLIYPGRSERMSVTAGMPPAFIALGAQDRDDIALGMAELYLKYKAAGVPAELHIYSSGVHGFGYRHGNTGAPAAWPSQMRDWLIDNKLLEDAKPHDVAHQ